MSDNAKHPKTTSESPQRSPDESPVTNEPSADSANFPIVAIGASAGGLEALTQLLKGLPADTGLAFVIIQHLDPRHESMLAPLLANQTLMPVVEALEGMLVEPNHAYIIPPNTRMAIGDGKLLLTPRSAGNARHLPIDHFFCSLAEQHRHRSIGVILSGTGSDGALGLEAIKSQGGITFAQDRSARFDSMPRQAVATGVVDFVLPPDGIARELASVSGHLLLGFKEPTEAIEDGSLRHVLGLLRKHSRVDFSGYKTNTVRRRLARRMAINHLSSADEYVVLLDRNPDELALLFDDLLISVTEFFRDEESFDELAKTAFPALVKGRSPDDPIRVWVPGCATGPEVYSLAIALTEYLQLAERSHPIQIFGTDVSEKAIAFARRGRFPENISSVLSQTRLNRFFAKVEGSYQVTRTLRELCVFSRQDVAKDPPLGRMDLISCRNLLIYMQPGLQRRVISIFSYALKPQGFLFLGSSESVGNSADVFVTVDSRHKIYSRDLKTIAPPSSGLVTASPPTATSPQVDDATRADRTADQMLLDEYAPSGFLLNSAFQVVKFRGNVGPYLAPPPGDPSLHVLGLVRADIARHLDHALKQITRDTTVVRLPRMKIRRNDGVREVILSVRPIRELTSENYFLVLFEEVAQHKRREVVASAPQEMEGAEQSPRDLSLELAATRTYMQRLVEELRAANEEAQSGNEELQSTNEELQTAKEELQSSNEELTTTNEEMHSRNAELTHLNSDLVNLLSSLQMPIVMLNSDLRIRRYTPIAQRLFNLIATDVGRPFSDLRPAIEQPNFHDLMLSVMRSEEAHVEEVQSANGHWYSLRIHPYRSTENRVEGVVLQLVDINPLKRTMEEVALERDYSGAILATVRESLLVLDSEFRLQTANQPFYDLFGLSPENTIGRALAELGEGEWNNPRVFAMLNAVRSGGSLDGTPVQIERTLQGVGLRTFELNANRVGGKAPNGLVLLALEDVTDRLKAAEAKYRRIFESAKDGILIVNAADGRVTDANPHALQLLNLDRHDVIERLFWDVLPLNLAALSVEEVLNSLRHEEVLRLPEIHLERDREIILEVMGSSYHEGEQQVIQLNIRDVTTRKQLENRLQQAAKLESLGVLAGGIAHDFNNLLTGIMGNASLALSDSSHGGPYRNSLREVVSATQKAADLTRQMLAYAGKGRFVTGPVNLASLVQEITPLVRSSISRSVEIHLDLAKGSALVEGDISQLQQVLMNLIINAAEAVDSSLRGTVRVATSVQEVEAKALKGSLTGEDVEPGRYVILTISDNGVGMSKETVARIFDPFFTTKFTGRGLGLAAVQGIVRSHRGALFCSTEPDRGTTFRVLLPALRAKLRKPRIARVDSGSLQGEGTILVVDDEPTVARMAKATLESHGYRAIVAENGEEALKIVEEQGDELAAVLLDVTMPVLGGEGALPRLRALLPEVPVILSSGYDAAEISERVKAHGVASFLQKPYTSRQLLEVLKQSMA